jgi:hypothetical protein
MPAESHGIQSLTVCMQRTSVDCKEALRHAGASERDGGQQQAAPLFD